VRNAVFSKHENDQLGAPDPTRPSTIASNPDRRSKQKAKQ